MEGKGDKLDFYTKLRKEYEKAPKPFIYEFSFSEQPKHKKFRILLGKFIQIMKDGMKDEYRFEEGNSGSFWNVFESRFRRMDQMSYIIDKVYEVAEKKIRIFFALLLQTRKLFQVLHSIVYDLHELYLAPEQKKKTFEADIAQLSFLRDGQIEVDSVYVKEFNEYLLAMKLTVIQLLRSLCEKAEDNVKDWNERMELEAEQRRREQERIQQAASKKPPVNVPKPPPPPELAPVTNPRVVPVSKPPKAVTGQTPLEPEMILKSKPKHLKNSEHLFNEQFKDELQVFSYASRPQPSMNKSNCFECQQPLSQGFYLFGANMNYCNYLGEWFCNDHTAEERVQIPFKAREEFDLRGYNVSKTGYERIKRYFEKPIIEIGYSDPVVKRNKRFYEFLILRRQVHLMYDSICNSELMDKMLKGRLNYCLQQNLFSLKNLYDIYNGHEGPHLENEFTILSKHFYRCPTCQERKGRLCAVCNHLPKIFAFELRETYSCERCQKISHRRCLQGNKCPCE